MNHELNHNAPEQNHETEASTESIRSLGEGAVKETIRIIDGKEFKVVNLDDPNKTAAENTQQQRSKLSSRQYRSVSSSRAKMRSERDHYGGYYDPYEGYYDPYDGLSQDPYV